MYFEYTAIYDVTLLINKRSLPQKSRACAFVRGGGGAGAAVINYFVTCYLHSRALILSHITKTIINILSKLDNNKILYNIILINGYMCSIVMLACT